LLPRQGRLTSANIGDSGFVVVGTTVKRGDLHIKYRSPQQEHGFGFPYQLGHQESADHPQDAMLTHISVSAARSA
jgi:protein phosphatase PTC7